MGLPDGSPPFQSWPEGGQPAGLDVELLRCQEQDTGLRFEFRRFDHCVPLLQALRRSEIWLATGMALSAERSTDLQFTRPYTSVPSTPDLAGRRLGVIASHVGETIAAERLPLASRTAYPTLSAAVQALARDELDRGRAARGPAAHRARLGRARGAARGPRPDAAGGGAGRGRRRAAGRGLVGDFAPAAQRDPAHPGGPGRGGAPGQRALPGLHDARGRNSLQSVSGAVDLLHRRASGDPALLAALGRSARATLGLVDGLPDRRRPRPRWPRAACAGCWCWRIRRSMRCC